MATPAPVSQLESHLGFWLRFVSNHVSGEFKRLVEANGVSVSEWVALRQLYNAGEATATELMDALGMTKGAVSKIITRLQDKGLVSRAAVPGVDKRQTRQLLWPQGRSACGAFPQRIAMPGQACHTPNPAERRSMPISISLSTASL